VIDRRSYVPAYRQVADALRAQIADGSLPPGRALPSESALEHEHGVARTTIRKAIAELRAEGVVETLPSSGTRVRLIPEREEFSLQRGSRVVIRMPTPAERAEYDIDEGVPVAIVRHGARTHLLIGDRVELIAK
jgi:DNA-binding transcriptional regulator YhcF (GntR family)